MPYLCISSARHRTDRLIDYAPSDDETHFYIPDEESEVQRAYLLTTLTQLSSGAAGVKPCVLTSVPCSVL